MSLSPGFLHSLEEAFSAWWNPRGLDLGTPVVDHENTNNYWCVSVWKHMHPFFILELHIIDHIFYNFDDDLNSPVNCILPCGANCWLWRFTKRICAVTSFFPYPVNWGQNKRCGDAVTKRKPIEYVYLPSDCEICESPEYPTRWIWKSSHKSSR